MLHTGITHKYAFIFSYLAQGAFVAAVVVEKMIKIKVGGKAKKARKSPPRELGYSSTSYQDQPPEESPGLPRF